MNLPNADRATVEPGKVRDYLLSGSHPVGRFKAKFFVALGYSAARWELLRRDLLTLAIAGEATLAQTNQFDWKLEVDGILTGPNGRSAEVRTVWKIESEQHPPRFVTA